MNKHLLPAKEIRAMFGGVSGMTLWRWLHDESLGFPKPIVIRKRRFLGRQRGRGISRPNGRRGHRSARGVALTTEDPPDDRPLRYVLTRTGN